MTTLPDLLKKLKSEMSARRDAGAMIWKKKLKTYSSSYLDAHKAGFDSRQSEVETLLKIVEKQNEALNRIENKQCDSLCGFLAEEAQAETLTLLKELCK